MNADTPDKSSKSGGDKAAPGQTAPSSPSQSSTTPAREASAPGQSKTGADAITAIEAFKQLGQNAPTATERAEAIAKIVELGASSPEAWSAAVEAITTLLEEAAPESAAPIDRKKRAICLGGGGPAVGLHIGALERLKEHHIDFGNDHSIWALSCIGAWVGVLYNQAEKGHEIETTYNFFRDVFRNDKSFKSFPANTVFTPDWAGNADAVRSFVLDPENYKNALLPREIMQSFVRTVSFLGDRRNWRRFSEGDFNRWTLNDILAVNPATRFLTALLYKSAISGRSRLYYNDSKFLNDIKFDKLDKRGKPFIFHNAFNFKTEDVDLFANKSPRWGRKGHKPISVASICACSALPYVEQTVEVDGNTYCEGALVDTVNFRRLLEDHHHPNQGDGLDEIWINRIVDAHQIRKPENLYDALANLCQLFAATVGEDDVKLFKYHVKENNSQPHHRLKWTGILVEIKVDSKINFQWSHSNLEHGRERGRLAAEATYKLYHAYKHKHRPDQVLMIPDDLNEKEIKDVLHGHVPEEAIKAVIGSREPL